MPQKLTLAVSQSRTLSTLSSTLSSLASTTRLAASQNVDLILFPEAFLGGYPRTAAFGATIGSRSEAGREQFLQYFHSCVDLGDTPTGAGEDWIQKKNLPIAEGKEYRGDGTREFLEQVARETGVFVVTGVVEKSGGTLYCAVVYVCPRRGVIGKRRKVMPTGSERLVWGQGSPATLKAITTTIRNVRVVMAAAICWENMMPLLRYSLYSQNVNLWLAPTADARDTWLPLMRTVGNEGRCFVLSSISCQKRKNLPEWVTGTTKTTTTNSTASATTTTTTTSTPAGPANSSRRRSIIVKEDEHELVLPSLSETHESQPPSSKQEKKKPTPAAAAASQSSTTATNAVNSAAGALGNSHGGEEEEDDDEFVCRGGSCIIGPFGQVLQEPLWDVEDGGLLVQEVDFEDCERGRLDLDVAGSYSRNDAFKLTVEGLDLNPPPS